METKNDSKNELIAALSEAANGKNRSKKARLAEIVDQIEQFKEQGLRRKEIVSVLASKQLIMSEATYATTIFRIKKERSIEKKQARPVFIDVTPTERLEPETINNHEVAKGEDANTNIQKPAGITDARWSEIKAETRAEARRQQLNQI